VLISVETPTNQTRNSKRQHVVAIPPSGTPLRPGLIRRLGGDDKLVARLDAMFDAKVDPKQYADVEDISGMIGQ